MPQNVPMDVEGDPAFIRVDTRRPAHELEPGVAADALNKRFEDGRAWPRYGVNTEPWGDLSVSWAQLVVPMLAITPSNPYNYAQSGIVQPNHPFFLTISGPGFATDAALPAGAGGFVPAGNRINPGLFIAGTTTLWLWGNTPLPSAAVTCHLWKVENPVGYARFNDPEGFDTQVLLTDDWRDQGGEDGGRGRAWRILSGNSPLPISLNGHDVWGTSRLIPCYNALVMLRQDNERHFFSAGAVNFSTSQIQLNTAPAWVNGDQVLYRQEVDGSQILGTTPPRHLTLYYVKNITGNKVELYTDPALSTKLSFSGGSATGKFSLERQSTTPGYFGNGSPPLILQPSSGVTSFDNGFLAVPLNVAALAFTSGTKLLEADNHRLIPGDKITYVHTTTALESFYVAVLSPNLVRLYTNETDALADNTTNAQTPSPAFTAGDVIKKDSASGMAMPPGREGVYLPSGRLVIVNGKNNLAISDPLDPLHFTPFAATVSANLGEADAIISIIPLGDDVVGKDQLVIAKELSLLRLVGLSGPSSGWALKEITREYGFLAGLATVRAGNDVWGFSRKGVVSVVQTLVGALNNQAQAIALPMSYDMKKYIDQVDWRFAGQAAAATWNNRFYLAVPLKGQTPPAGQNPVNNGVLVYNFLNQGWEGLWQGDGLQVFAWARHNVYGEERLAFVNYFGQVAWLGDGWTDVILTASGVPIVDSLTTRIYCKGNQDPKLWLKGKVVWDTHNPLLTVTAVAPGYNEQQPLLTALAYDNTKYFTEGTPDYVPGTSNFDAPNRQDYSLSPAELTSGALDVHQNIPENLRLRVNDWGVQLVIQNAQGSARVQSVELSYVPALRTASRSS